MRRLLLILVAWAGAQAQYVPAGGAGAGDMAKADYAPAGAGAPASPCGTAGAIYRNTTPTPHTMYLCPSAGGTWIGPFLAADGDGNVLIASTLPTLYTIGGTLPAAAAGNAGQVRTVSNGATLSDCTVGAGTAVHECYSTGSVWTAYAGGGVTPASVTGIRKSAGAATTDTAAAASDVTGLFSGAGDYLKSDGSKGTPAGNPPYNLGAVYAIGDPGATETIAASNGSVQTMTLSANLTIDFTQPVGYVGIVRIGITQNASAAKTVTWTSVKWPAGIAPIMTATLSAIDWYSCLLDGTNTYCTPGQDFK